MRELMLKLLTYEPFEKITGDEKNIYRCCAGWGY